MMNTSSPSDNHYHTDHVRMMLTSHKKLVGTDLFVPDISIFQGLGEQVWNAPFVLVSQGAEVDPILNYANKRGLDRFEYPWNILVNTPGRLTAEEANQADREKLLKQVREDGYSKQYSGTRITGTGSRFEIVGATVWSILDENGAYKGLAASFAKWKKVD